VAAAVSHVGPPVGDAFTPGVIVELSVELYIGASQPYALAVDAGEVGLAAGTRAKPAVERVIPHVELIGIRRIGQRYKVDGRHRSAVGSFDGVGDVDDILVGADTVVGGNFVTG
jgi:hypothetical protein